MITIPGKIPINIHPFFWIMCFGIGALNTMSIPGTMILGGVIFISVLIHEFGHALSALAFGQRPVIDLIALGGLTSRQGPKLKLWQDFVIVLCGPLAGFALAGVSFFAFALLLDSGMPFLVFALNAAVFVNVFWTVVNLFPIQPLDGGHLLRIILEGAMGMKGVKFAYIISIIAAVLVAIAAFLFAQLFIGAIMFMLAFESYKGLQGIMAMRAEDQDETLQSLLDDAEKDFRHGELEEAERKLQHLRERAGSGVLFVEASVLLARILTQRSQYREAYELIKFLQSKLDSGGLVLLHQLAYKMEDFRSAISLGNDAYQINPSYQTALINALSHAMLGEAAPAAGWFNRAVSDGLPNPEQVFERKEFDRIRHDPAFK